MKMKALVWVAVVFLVFLVGVGCFAFNKGTYGFYRPEYDEEIYGTWVNERPSDGWKQKQIYYNWGGWEGYFKTTDKAPAYKGTSILVNKWRDAEGNIWCREYWRGPGNSAGLCGLDRISSDGKVLEYVEDAIMWPVETDLIEKNMKYGIYYHQ